MSGDSIQKKLELVKNKFAEQCGARVLMKTFFVSNSRTTLDQDNLRPVLDVPHLDTKKTCPNMVSPTSSSWCKLRKIHFVELTLKKSGKIDLPIP
jgi:hypothetical protein